jgi:hypothetical protein
LSVIGYKLEIDEIRNKIEGWINNVNDPKMKISREAEYDPVNNPSLLKIVRSFPSADLPISIIKPKKYSNLIGVYTGIIFNEQQKKSFHSGLKPLEKNAIISEISSGLMMMNLGSKFLPEKSNFDRIAFQDKIYFDGFSQDRLMNSVQKVSMAYAYVIATLKKHNLMQKGFNPSDLI